MTNDLQKTTWITLCLAIAFLLSCSDNPSLEFPGEKEWLEKWFQSSSYSEPSSSSSACTAKDNGEYKYCSNGSLKNYSIMEGNTEKPSYKAVEIGEQIWTAENLAYSENGECNTDKNDNCSSCGNLYTYEIAINICTKGWHLPEYSEWYTLENFVNGATNKLKAISGWSDSNGNDTYGFAALPCGYNNSNQPNGYNGVGYIGSWWAKQELDKGQSRIIKIEGDKFIDFTGDNAIKASVRCIKDIK